MNNINNHLEGASNSFDKLSSGLDSPAGSGSWSSWSVTAESNEDNSALAENSLPDISDLFPFTGSDSIWGRGVECADFNYDDCSYSGIDLSGFWNGLDGFEYESLSEVLVVNVPVINEELIGDNNYVEKRSYAQISKDNESIGGAQKQSNKRNKKSPIDKELVSQIKEVKSQIIQKLAKEPLEKEDVFYIINENSKIFSIDRNRGVKFTDILIKLSRNPEYILWFIEVRLSSGRRIHFLSEWMYYIKPAIKNVKKEKLEEFWRNYEQKMAFHHTLKDVIQRAIKEKNSELENGV